MAVRVLSAMLMAILNVRETQNLKHKLITTSRYYDKLPDKHLTRSYCSSLTNSHSSHVRYLEHFCSEYLDRYIEILRQIS